MNTFEAITLTTEPPGGFDVPKYLAEVKDAFDEKFMPTDDTEIVKAITFAESRDFEKIDIELPAIILDLQGAKLNPSTGEFEHRGNNIYSNLGELELYAFMKASILVSNRDTDPQLLVRRLAFDVAGFVTESSRFRHPTGMSQVTHIEPEDMARRNTQTTIEWCVQWQHSVSLGEPDYRDLFPYPCIDAADVKCVLVGIQPDTENPIIEKIDTDGNTYNTREGYQEVYRRPTQE